MAYPLKTSEAHFGVLAVFAIGHQGFTKREQRQIEVIAELVNGILENFFKTKQIQKVQEEAVAAKQIAILGTAMAALQHRINNTLNIIVPNVTRLRGRVNTQDAEIGEILNIIERNVRYATHMVDQVQAPLQRLDKQTVNINATLAEIIGKRQDTYRSQTSVASIEVDFKPDESIPMIEASGDQLAEVFRNLVENAGREMVNGGKLTVTSCYVNRQIEVRVQDTGPGIPPAIRERLFFKPVSSKDPGSGAGLGLWLNRLLLQTIGGSITIESSDETGSTFLVTIPVV